MSVGQQLADELEQFVIDLLQIPIRIDAKQGNNIVHIMKMAFIAAYDSKPPRWQIGDKFLLRSKTRRECTVTDIIRTFAENGNMSIRYRASHDFMGQKISDTYSETTIARGRICPNTGKAIESGQEIG